MGWGDCSGVQHSSHECEELDSSALKSQKSPMRWVSQVSNLRGERQKQKTLQSSWDQPAWFAKWWTIGRLPQTRWNVRTNTHGGLWPLHECCARHMHTDVQTLTHSYIHMQRLEKQILQNGSWPIYSPPRKDGVLAAPHLRKLGVPCLFQGRHWSAVIFLMPI